MTLGTLYSGNKSGFSVFKVRTPWARKTWERLKQRENRKFFILEDKWCDCIEARNEELVGVECDQRSTYELNLFRRKERTAVVRRYQTANQ